MRPRREVFPAEDVDSDEDRLEEEEDALDREQHAEDLPEATREGRPEQPELEREDGVCDSTDRKRDGDRLRPAPGELQRVRVVMAQAAVVRDQHYRRQRHAERREDDVETERESHL